MDTIISYLNNLFANLPKTSQVLAVKSQLEASMEDKYQALKAEGKTENEAIGAVIAEFGNIDELVSELGIKPAIDDQSTRVVDAAEVGQYLSATRQAAVLVGLGVFCCISAAASLILVGQLITDNLIHLALTNSARESLALIPLFIFVAIGVSLFIYSGLKLDRYKYLESEPFVLPDAVKADVQRQYETFNPTFTLGIMIGVGLCILSPLAIFLASLIDQRNSGYGVPGLLLMVAIAVFFFVYFGTIRDAYNKLLKLEDYANKSKQQNDKVIGLVASIVWPLTVAGYLLFSFLTQAWGLSWIVFPVVGLLFGVFAAIYSSVKHQ